LLCVIFVVLICLFARWLFCLFQLTQEFRKCAFEMEMEYAGAYAHFHIFPFCGRCLDIFFLVEGSDYTVDMKWQKSARMSTFALGYSQSVTRHIAAGISTQFLSAGSRHM
jgi:hypothetical protein